MTEFSGFGFEWWQYVSFTLVCANILFLGVGGGIHYFYYHKKREQDKEWKMQPGKYLSPKLAKKAAIVGTLNLNWAAGTFGFLGWGVIEHGWGQIYYDFNSLSDSAYINYGWAGLSVFLAFLLIEAGAYYSHAIVHNPWLYKKIHVYHHLYTAPTFFTISAMHPLEWALHASYVIAPAFVFPMHWSLYMFVMMTTFYYGFWDHAGIRLKHNLPLHGSNRFHDDHHIYFHVNYGFMTPLFDRLHNTMRREGHHYNEDTFTGGQGRVNHEALGNNAIGKWIDYTADWRQNPAPSKQPKLK